MVENGPPKVNLVAESSLDSDRYDGIILVKAPDQKLRIDTLNEAVERGLIFDPALKHEVGVIPVTGLPAGRLVYSPTGAVDPDYDDVKVFVNAATKGIERAVKSGMKQPLLVVEEYPRFPDVELATILGAVKALHVPIQLRELEPSKREKVNLLGVYSANSMKTAQLVDLAIKLETGRRVACDIGDADPERMSPPKVEEYVTSVFKDSHTKVTVIKDLKQVTKEYPLFEAVNRAARNIERHQGRIIYLEYNPPNPDKIEKTLFLVGKGVTYDTGGADIKAGGVMAGMSRDKCGAAAVAGFMKVVNDFKPENLKVVAGLSVVRNSVGSDSYVADELIVARSGAKVRVGNTDAEGRMVLADVLCKLKEEAISAVNPHLYTIATLTGHAHLTAGIGYSIVMDNGPARKVGHAQELQKAGDDIGDPFEISIVRREDFNFHKGKVESEDIMQCNNLPSSRTARGHQGPAAFIIMASGLDKYGSGSEKPLKYSHLDIAASAGDHPFPATGAPVLALAKKHLL